MWLKRTLPLALMLVGLVAASSLPPAAEGGQVAEAAPRSAVLDDWMLQDHGKDPKECFTSKSGAQVEAEMVTRALEQLGPAAKMYRETLERLVKAAAPGSDGRWKDLYVSVCEHRRLTFDQVHTNYPQVMDDGRVVYTRWDYNDRGRIYPQPLFQMNPDGTAQTEYYGNNSWFPTTILHARGIPGTEKVMAVLSGHHCHQRGKLAIIDPSRGQQEADGVQLIAPVRETKAVRVDAYGQGGEQFQYPCPISETEFLVAYHPDPGGNRKYRGTFGIYWMDVDSRRERDDLAPSDPRNSLLFMAILSSLFVSV